MTGPSRLGTAATLLALGPPLAALRPSDATVPPETLPAAAGGARPAAAPALAAFRRSDATVPPETRAAPASGARTAAASAAVAPLGGASSADPVDPLPLPPPPPALAEPRAPAPAALSGPEPAPVAPPASPDARRWSRRDRFPEPDLGPDDWRPPEGPVRIGIQAGHWRASEAPGELAGLRDNGTRWQSVAEWEVNPELARRAAAR